MEDVVTLSRHLSYVLRHRPDSVGLDLDPGGWVDVDRLLAALVADGREITRSDLSAVQAHGDKQRFEIRDGRIRARYGHSVEVDLDLQPRPPPDVLFHGTVARFLDAIDRDGLRAGSRQYVHLSEDVATAEQVGRRRGQPVVLVVDAAGMADHGHEFLAAADGVWLTSHVPAEHLRRTGFDRRT